MACELIAGLGAHYQLVQAQSPQLFEPEHGMICPTVMVLPMVFLIPHSALSLQVSLLRDQYNLWSTDANVKCLVLKANGGKVILPSQIV